jgi:hypothetical protein
MSCTFRSRLNPSLAPVIGASFFKRKSMSEISETLQELAAEPDFFEQVEEVIHIVEVWVKRAHYRVEILGLPRNLCVKRETR